MKKRIRDRLNQFNRDSRSQLISKVFDTLWNAQSIKRGDGPLLFLSYRRYV